MTEKLCPRCGESKDSSAFSPAKKERDGLFCYCKACNRARIAERRAANPERAREIARNAAERKRAANPEQAAAKQRAYRAANLERLRAARIANHTQNRDRELARNRAWKQANRPKVVAAIARRTAAKLQATVAWSDRAKIEEIYFAADFLGMVTGEWYHVDHIVPLQSKIVCGLHCDANLQVIPGAENQSKSNRFWPDMPDRAGV
jgi:hypothetical protein